MLRAGIVIYTAEAEYLLTLKFCFIPQLLNPRLHRSLLIACRSALRTFHLYRRPCPFVPSDHFPYLNRQRPIASSDIINLCHPCLGNLKAESAGFPLYSNLHNTMSGHTFPGRLDTNPFGTQTASPGDQVSSGSISKVVEEEENDTITSPTNPKFGFGKSDGTTFGSPFGGDASDDGPPSSFKPTSAEGFPSNYGMGRRTSVSAESLNPTASTNENWTAPFHQKTSDQLERLRKSISGNFLFAHLDDEQTSQVLGALVEKPIPAKGIKVCTCQISF